MPRGAGAAWLRWVGAALGTAAVAGALAAFVVVVDASPGVFGGVSVRGAAALWEAAGAALTAAAVLHAGASGAVGAWGDAARARVYADCQELWVIAADHEATKDEAAQLQRALAGVVGGAASAPLEVLGPFSDAEREYLARAASGGPGRPAPALPGGVYLTVLERRLLARCSGNSAIRLLFASLRAGDAASGAARARARALAPLSYTLGVLGVVWSGTLASPLLASPWVPSRGWAAGYACVAAFAWGLLWHVDAFMAGGHAELSLFPPLPPVPVVQKRPRQDSALGRRGRRSSQRAMSMSMSGISEASEMATPAHHWAAFKAGPGGTPSPPVWTLDHTANAPTPPSAQDAHSRDRLLAGAAGSPPPRAERVKAAPSPPRGGRRGPVPPPPVLPRSYVADVPLETHIHPRPGHPIHKVRSPRHAAESEPDAAAVLSATSVDSAARDVVPRTDATQPLVPHGSPVAADIVPPLFLAPVSPATPPAAPDASPRTPAGAPAAAAPEEEVPLKATAPATPTGDAAPAAGSDDGSEGEGVWI